MRNVAARLECNMKRQDPLCVVQMVTKTRRFVASRGGMLLQRDEGNLHGGTTSIQSLALFVG